jgi:hypothetical protein
MVENGPSVRGEMKISGMEKKLYALLLEEKQETDRIRNDSKMLSFLTSLSTYKDQIVRGEINPLLGLSTVVFLTGGPFLLVALGDSTATQIAASVLSAIGAGAGWASLVEKKAPIFSRGRNMVINWSDNWIITKEKTRIDGRDISNVLINLPRNQIKGPEEIHSLLKDNKIPEKKTDPFGSVAKRVYGVVAVEINAEQKHADQRLTKEEIEEKVIKRTTILMLGGQIRVQLRTRLPAQMAVDTWRMEINAIGGGVTGATLSVITSLLFGGQWGALFGLADDGPIYDWAKDLVVNKLKKVKEAKKQKEKAISSDSEQKPQ